MRQSIFILALVVFVFSSCVQNQKPKIIEQTGETTEQVPSVVALANKNIRSTALTTKYLAPTRVVWTTDNAGELVKNAESILKPGIGQADLKIRNRQEKFGFVLESR